MPHRQSRTRPRTRQPDEMFGRNIRNKQRSPDREPTDIPAGQKIIFRSPFLPREIKPNRKHNHEVNRNHANIQGIERAVRHSGNNKVRHSRNDEVHLLLLVFVRQSSLIHPIKKQVAPASLPASYDRNLSPRPRSPAARPISFSAFLHFSF